MRCDTNPTGVQEDMETKQQMVEVVALASSFAQYLHHIDCKV